MLRWLDIIDKLCVWMGAAAGVALTFLAIFTIVDVVLRYLFNAPIAGSIDVIQLSLVVMTFCALPYAGRTDGHIVVDLVPDFSKPWLTGWRDAAGKTLTAVIFGLLAWQGWLRADESMLLGEASNMLEIPYRRFYQLMALCAGVYAAALLTEALFRARGRDLPILKKGLDDDPLSRSLEE